MSFSKGKLFRKMRILVYLVVVGVILLLCLRAGYQIYINSIHYNYQGTILVAKGSGIYIAINPNDWDQRAKVDLSPYLISESQQYLSFPEFVDNNIYAVSYDSKEYYRYSIVRIHNGSSEMFPIKVTVNYKTVPQLLSVQGNLFLALDGKIYYIPQAEESLQISCIYTEWLTGRPVLPYRGGVLVVKKDNNKIVYINASKQEDLFQLPMGYRLQGWYEEGKSFLVTDNKNNTIILDAKGKEIGFFGRQPEYVLGNEGSQAVLLMMMPKYEGGASILDFEWHVIDIFRTDSRRIYQPYVYNLKTHDSRSFKGNDRAMYWIKQDFNKIQQLQ